MDNIKIGAHVSIAGGLNNAIDSAKNIGANCIQIFSSAPQSWNRKKYEDSELQEFKELVADNDLNPIFVHAPYLPNICTDKPENLEKSIIALASELTFVNKIGAKGLIVHLGSHLGQGFEKVLDQIVDSIAEIYKVSGYSNNFTLEVSSGKKNVVGAKLEEVSKIIEVLKTKHNITCDVCLDTAHLFAAGYEIHTKEGANSFVEKLKDLNLLSKITCIHVNDSKVELANGNDRHENIGEGFIGVDGFKNFFNHEEFKQIPLVLEVPGFEKKGPDKQNIEKLREIVI